MPAPSRRHFVIEDQWHCEILGSFDSFQAAVDELKRLASIDWDQQPNVAPCISWKTCGRSYEIREYDISVTPWTLLSQVEALEVDANGVRWRGDFGAASP